MTELARDAAIDAAELLTHYSFDLGGFTVERLIDYWLREYPANWLQPALVEALYQGRYKAVSVTQILTLWKRRGQPLYHFNHEFERMVCGKFPKTLNAPSEPTASSRSAQPSSLSGDRPSAPSLPETREVKEPHPVEHPTEETTAAGETASDSPTDAPTAAELVDTSRNDESGQESPQTDPSDRPIRALLPAAKPPEPFPPSEEVFSATPLPPSPSKPSESSEPSKFAEASSKPAAPIQPSGSEGVDSPIPTFKPVNAGLDTTELVQWAGDRVSKHPIHQFVPATGVSNFYAKLKAVVQSRDDYFTDLALAGDSISFPEQRERE